jgi:hypothetical protein
MMNRRWRALGLTILAGLAGSASIPGARAATPAWMVGPDFAVQVSLSPKAAARLARPKETIVISADFYGDANARGRRRENEIGQIVLSPTQKDEIAGAGVARFHGPRYDKTLLGDVDANGLQVLINVFSGRHSSPDNLLDCDLFQDKVSIAAKATIPIHCKLIGE